MVDIIVENTNIKIVDDFLEKNYSDEQLKKMSHLGEMDEVCDC
jgi:hypothetical protein